MIKNHPEDVACARALILKQKIRLGVIADISPPGIDHFALGVIGITELPDDRPRDRDHIQRS
ncbi:MAG: hypothetical protein BWY42_01507 [Candidatus Omnitrophica bacterium ADurb.Bin277]|nr:MAG: hypothetical protein BWY42_01507 [Candidatus Omnitrophica bacterium ADurb.Bin277]